MKASVLVKALLLALLPLSFALSAQAQVRMAEFLGAAAQDPTLEVYSKKLEHLHHKPYRLAPLRDLEFRFKNNELYKGEHDYGLRLSLANPWHLKSNSRYFKAYQSVLTAEQGLAMKEVLEARYTLVLELAFVSEQITVKQKLLANLQNQVKILENQRSSSFFDESDYVKLRLELLEEQTSLEGLQYELEKQKNVVHQLYPSTGLQENNWTFSNMVPPQRLHQLLDSLLTLPLYTARLGYYQERLKLAGSEYDLQRTKVNPGFIQTDYQPSNGKHPYGLSAGIRIPLFNPNKGDMTEKKLEMIEVRNELELEEQKAREEIEHLQKSLKGNLLRYQTLEEKESTYDLKSMFSALSELNRKNPIISLKMNAQLLKLQSLKVQQKRDIYQSYLQFLVAADLLHQRPLVNYFSPVLEPL
ncbi:hypothetical protein TH63_02375 [Rufibacter radiotolerans]|uniref:Outer membrane efflux protein n=1 Tax=Rufibacter radiotolerans TaxID=1379910 RepID=A0A0H4VGK1_9BACT|nr:hypothetical protein [Rufibacter radiotolerans]AKQ44730.1 hypothetical protein TH63_02375 [Rufibacter radiotolerans]